jgi:hypothetical protein
MEKYWTNRCLKYVQNIFQNYKNIRHDNEYLKLYIAPEITKIINYRIV